MIVIPLRTRRGLNDREHYLARARRVKREKAVVGWHLRAIEKPPIPCSVALTRIAPSSGVDDDQVVGSLKAVRDAVAEWLGVDDRYRNQVRYRYAQRRGPWGVGVEFGPPPVGAQLTFELEVDA